MTEFVEVNVRDLVGPALDWAVGLCMGWEYRKCRNLACMGWYDGKQENFQCISWRPSTDWTQGGELLEKYCSSFGLVQDSSRNNWRAFAYKTDAQDVEFKRLAGGPTILVAACRAIVLVSLGDTVKVPAELMP